MALNVGQNFKKRWLDAPEAVRQSFRDELMRICDLLTPESNVNQWLDHDQRAMQIAQLNVEQAYAQLKAELIEAARLRKQLALEKSLSEKRAQQQAYAEQLLQDEAQQFQAQTQSLSVLRQSIEQDTREYSARYEANPSPAENNRLNAAAHLDLTADLDSIRLRLELEAESMIDQSVQQFKERLQHAAQEEIEYILKQNHDL